MNFLLPLLTSVLTKMLETMPAETAKVFVDDMLDKLEDLITSSENSWDDAFVLPLIAKLREVASIPDDIAGDED